MLHVISARYVERGLHTIAPWSLERTCMNCASSGRRRRRRSSSSSRGGAANAGSVCK